MAPVLAKHRNAIFMNETLFRRVERCTSRGKPRPDSRTEAGARALSHDLRARRREAGPARTRSGLRRSPNALRASAPSSRRTCWRTRKPIALVLDGEADLAGLAVVPSRIGVACGGRRARPAGKHVITLSRSSIEPFLQFSQRRDLREQAFRAWTARGEHGGPTDNSAIIAGMMALRAERAKLLGYETFADFKLADTMAKTPEAVFGLLNEVWAPALPRHGRARRTSGVLRRAGDNITIEPWGWRYYAEKVRLARHDLDEAIGQAYFQLDRIIAAAFETAHRLFGINSRSSGLPTLPSGHSRMARRRPGREAGRDVHRRLFRPAVEAQRRLDERVPVAGAATGDVLRSSST